MLIIVNVNVDFKHNGVMNQCFGYTTFITYRYSYIVWENSFQIKVYFALAIK